MRYAMDVVGKQTVQLEQWLSPILAYFSFSESRSNHHLQLQWIQLHPFCQAQKKHVLCFFRPGSQHHHHTRVSFLSLPTEPWESPVAIRPPRRWRGCCPNAMAAGWRQRRRWPNTAWRLSHSAEIRCAQHGAHHFSLRKTTGTIWLFNIAMENPHF